MTELEFDADALYRVLIDASPEGVTAIDERSTILLANRAMEEIVGRPAEQLVGHALTDLMPEQIQPMHEHGMSRDIESGRRTLDWRGISTTGLRASGEEFPIEISFGEARIRGTRAFLGYVREVSDREQAIAALQHAERLHDTILASVGEAILGFDSTGRTTFAIPAAYALLGYSSSELLGRNQHDVLHHSRMAGRSHALADCPMFAALTDGRRYHGADELFSRKDGRTCPSTWSAPQPPARREWWAASSPSATSRTAVVWKRSPGRRRSSRRWGSSRAASRTTSTTCSPSSSPRRDSSWSVLLTAVRSALAAE